MEEVNDATLLGRFITLENDERAFTAVRGSAYGAMVHQVCWRTLGNGDAADDAFQATFLVLARKASTVRPREALPAWLHGVARRVALKARSARIRQHKTGPLSEAPPDKRPDPLTEISARELLSIIDEEVQRLPERYRLPVILCCLGGQSLEEAAPAKTGLDVRLCQGAPGTRPGTPACPSGSPWPDAFRGPGRRGDFSSHDVRGCTCRSGRPYDPRSSSLRSRPGNSGELRPTPPPPWPFPELAWP